MFDTSVRTSVYYLAADYLGSIAVVSAVFGMLLLVRPWPQRREFIIAGIAIIAIAVCGVAAGKRYWSAGETESRAALSASSYPFDEKVQNRSCGSTSTRFAETSWVAGASRVSPEASRCSDVVFYRGWTKVGQFELREPQSLVKGFLLAEPATEIVYYAAVVDSNEADQSNERVSFYPNAVVDQYLLVGILARTGEIVWSRPLGPVTSPRPDRVWTSGSVVIVEDEFGGKARIKQAVGIDIRDGTVLWEARCDRGLRTADFGQDSEVVAVTCERLDGSGELVEMVLTSDGQIKPS